jgi:hypothetical protein
LERERSKDVYKDSQRERVLVRNELRSLNSNDLKEVLDFIHEIKNRNLNSESSKPDFVEEIKDNENSEKAKIVCSHC